MKLIKKKNKKKSANQKRLRSLIPKQLNAKEQNVLNIKLKKVHKKKPNQLKLTCRTHGLCDEIKIKKYKGEKKITKPNIKKKLNS